MRDVDEPVDGYSDRGGEQGGDIPNEPDPMPEGQEPLSPDEYAKAQEEIREQGDSNRLDDEQ